MTCRIARAVSSFPKLRPGWPMQSPMSTQGGTTSATGKKPDLKNEIDFHVVLQEATHSEVADAIAEAVDRLDFHSTTPRAGH